MSSLVRLVFARCSDFRAELVRSTCAMPFGATAGTPLDGVVGAYLALVSGFGLFGGTGSAVIIRPGLAVTSAHLVEDRQRLVAFAVDGPLEVEVIARSERMDLAILSVPRSAGGGVAARAVSVGEAVWAMGTTSGSLMPTAGGVVETTGAVVRVEAADDCMGPFHQGLMYAAAGGAGYSGGPVVDAAARLVGLTVGIYTKIDGERPASWPRRPRMFAYHALDVVAEAEALVGR